MSNYRPKNRGRIIFVTAIITIIIFAVTLYSIQNPDVVKEIISDSSFDTSQDFIKFVDVGQADCAIIYSNGYCAVIDVGLASRVGDIENCLDEYNVESIDVAIISHLHSDHVGGLPKIANDYKIENLIMPPLKSNSITAAKNGKDTAIKSGTQVYDAKSGMNFELGEFKITLLSGSNDEANENNGSLFVMAEIDDTNFLFTGDAETKVEKRLLESEMNIDCDILKVAHHGSDTSSSEAFLKATTPEYAVISVGESNMYSHPHDVTLRSLKTVGAEIYRTDKMGDITFDMTDNKIKIVQEKMNKGSIINVGQPSRAYKVVKAHYAETIGTKCRDIAIAMGVEGVEKMTQEEYRAAAVDAVKKTCRKCWHCLLAQMCI